MRPADDMENHRGENVGLDEYDSTGRKDIAPLNLLSIKQQLINQCFEMEVHLNAGKSERSWSTSEAEKDLPDYIQEVEGVKTFHLNGTLALQRMQIWHAIEEKLKLNDPEADALKTLTDHCLALCSRIKELQQESRALQDEIIEMEEKRREVKRRTNEKVKEMDLLRLKKKPPIPGKYKALWEKGQSNLEKYRKMTIMIQNVLQSLISGFKINWLDDPKLRDIAMTLEDLPMSD